MRRRAIVPVYHFSENLLEARNARTESIGMSSPPPPAQRDTLVLAITGGSGSGKTTVAEALGRALLPKTVLILREDDYYRDNAATPGFDPDRFNFDHVDTRDHTLLADHLAALKAGRAIAMPRYDFVRHARRAERVPAEPADIVIVEGIHALHDPALRALYDLSVYLDVPDDIRLLRRMVRDVLDRQRTVETVAAQYARTVRPMHYAYTEPCRQWADLVIQCAELPDAGPMQDELDRIVDLLARTVLESAGSAL